MAHDAQHKQQDSGMKAKMHHAKEKLKEKAHRAKEKIKEKVEHIKEKMHDSDKHDEPDDLQPVMLDADAKTVDKDAAIRRGEMPQGLGDSSTSASSRSSSSSSHLQTVDTPHDQQPAKLGGGSGTVNKGEAIRDGEMPQGDAEDSLSSASSSSSDSETVNTPRDKQHATPDTKAGTVSKDEANRQGLVDADTGSQSSGKSRSRRKSKTGSVGETGKAKKNTPHAMETNTLAVLTPSEGVMIFRNDEDAVSEEQDTVGEDLAGSRGEMPRNVVEAVPAISSSGRNWESVAVPPDQQPAKLDSIVDPVAKDDTATRHSETPQGVTDAVTDSNNVKVDTEAKPFEQLDDSADTTSKDEAISRGEMPHSVVYADANRNTQSSSSSRNLQGLGKNPEAKETTDNMAVHMPNAGTMHTIYRNDVGNITKYAVGEALDLENDHVQPAESVENVRKDKGILPNSEVQWHRGDTPMLVGGEDNTGASDTSERSGEGVPEPISGVVRFQDDGAVKVRWHQGKTADEGEEWETKVNPASDAPESNDKLRPVQGDPGEVDKFKVVGCDEPWQDPVLD